MSSLLPELRCAICEGPIQPADPHFRASGDFLPKNDPLVDFTNKPMHWDCYMPWEHRPRFARHFVDAWVKANRKNPFWWSVLHDDRVYVSVNPGRGVEEASVRLYSLGADIRVPLPRWPEWLANPTAVTPGLHKYEQDALAEVLPTLRERFPDDHAVVHAIDPAEKPSRG